MASTQSSAVLVQDASPPHTLMSDINSTPLPDTPEEIRTGPATTNAPHPQEEQQPVDQTAAESPNQADTPMTDAPDSTIPDGQTATVMQTQPQDENVIPTESPEQLPHPTNEVSENAISESQEQNAGDNTLPSSESQPEQEPPSEPPRTEPEPTLPPTEPSIPEWVTWEDDMSAPSEEELKEVEGSDAELSALNVPALEGKFFTPWDDTDQRPMKKIRLSWTIKGIRGTKDRPNMAPIMNSPAALVDGNYWQIKFYPRGNNVDDLSAYIRCTKHRPEADPEVPESTFLCFEGPPDANMGEGAEPKDVIKVQATPPISSSKEAGEAEPKDDVVKTDPNPDSLERSNSTTQGASDATTTNVQRTDATDPQTIVVQELGTAPSDGQPNEEGPQAPSSKAEEPEDYRVSAQLGMTIYNPDEPRTCAWNSSEHQFCRFNDDWGWTKFVGPWNQIHKRQRGQRQPLLRKDTIAIDAYIRVFDDPTQSLWWSAPPDGREQYWPSKKLAGYFPMGTRLLFHSPAVAGITAWLLLAPFRQVLESVDSETWLHDSQARPRPFIARMQHVLHLLRHLKHDSYVNVDPVLDTLKEYGETWNDVTSFWEIFRRAIELELEHDGDSLKKISDVFDLEGSRRSIPKLPIKGMHDVQTALKAVTLPTEYGKACPNFLPLILEREIFDHARREWKLHYDRVTMNEEVVLETLNYKETYVLYGFIVHTEARTSGKFYSILRPNGPGSKWLAFEDGDGNKVFSYTKKKIAEYEGLLGEDLANLKSTRQTAHVVMYIKKSCLAEYLPGQLGDWNVPEWLPVPGDAKDDNEVKSVNPKDSNETEIPVEIYHDRAVDGRRGLLDMLNVKQKSLAGNHVRTTSYPRTMSVMDLRQQLANDMGLDDVKKLRIFLLLYGELGQYSNANWYPLKPKKTLVDELARIEKEWKSHRKSLSAIPSIRARPVCLWTSVLATEEDMRLFGVPDPITSTQKEFGEGADIGDAIAALEGGVFDQAEAAVMTPEAAAAAEVSNEGPQEQVDVSAPVESTPPHDAPNSPEVAMVSVDEPPQPNEASNSADVEMQTSETVNGQPAEEVQSPEAEMPDADVQRAHESVLLAPTAELMAIDATEPRPVEHGHLIDAVMTDGAVVVQQTVTAVTEAHVAAAAHSTDEADEAAIAALIAQDFDLTPNPPAPNQPAEIATAVNEEPGTNTAAAQIPEQSRTTPQKPVSNVYGFLQFFDVDAQDFIVHKTFFAKKHESVKEAMRRLMDYDQEKQFHAWHRSNTTNGAGVGDSQTFSDIGFTDGVDIIVGDVLSDEKKAQLRSEGKFSNPFDFSRFLRMKERRHPVQSRTTTAGEVVEIHEFGGSYYKGPLVNGQPHGAQCYVINANGAVYEGPLACDKRTGANGKMTYQNGDVYEGEWLNDERHGHGVMVEARTGNRYVGGWRDDKPWGKGTTHWEVATDQARTCQICYDESMDALFYDCGHVCACVECAKQCESCPICRKAIRSVVKMYWA